MKQNFIVLPVVWLCIIFIPISDAFARNFSVNRHTVQYIASPFPAAGAGKLGICSFNIHWLGHWKVKDNDRLAKILQNCDVAIIQEMVAPPWEVRVLKNGKPFTIKQDPESRMFVDAMQMVGFDGVALSPEDTGPNTNQNNSPVSEWYIMFYKTDKVELANDLPNGFLSPVLTKNAVYSRVPYAFAIRTKKAEHETKQIDMVLISVHLHSNGSEESLVLSQARRVVEFREMALWIERQILSHPSGERDFIILGDVNIENIEEYAAFKGEFSSRLAIPILERIEKSEEGPLLEADLRYRSLNSNGLGDSTILYATNIKLTKPYDHVFYSTHHSTLTIDDRLMIFNMAKAFEFNKFPTTSSFVMTYSDHNPLKFSVEITEDGD